jgi:alanyl-tRNA synthetase
VTGRAALEWVAASDELIRELAGLVKAGRDDVADKVRQLIERSRKLEKEFAQLKSKLASGQGNDLSANAIDVAGTKLVATVIEGADVPTLREAVDQLKNKLKSAIIVLASVAADGKVALIAGVTADQTTRVKAGDLANFVAQQLGGRGGGRPDMAQAGGTDAAKLPEALASIHEWIHTKLVS